MRIPSDEIPQADRLSEVVRTVICIAQGGTTFQDIAAFINKVDRQGRYYRKAAEIIGMIETPQRNHSVLTALGQQFIQSGATLNNPLLIQSVLNARVFQRIIPYLELNTVNGVDREDIVSFIVSVADIIGDTMAPRRFSSVVAWLEELQIIQRHGDRFYLANNIINNSVPILNFTNVDEPLLPRTTNLQEYQTVEMRTNRASETVVTYRNQAATERADNAHRRIVNLVADRIRNVGAIPRYNQLIDLATRVNNTDFIFEMKSITDDNSKSQVRSGLSQLYEYSYLQNLPTASLVLVIERPLPANTQWMVDYLETNRNIQVVWDGDNNLYGTQRSRELLPFLNLLP
ncbi:DUF7226 domain-containing protein [Microcoleus sp. F10-A1]|uniref:DUF7226 domain-containing protein n=1 Tax=Microcoleus sp. F10-A1 TaxID=2818750 RepID=UPI002FD4B7BA